MTLVYLDQHRAKLRLDPRGVIRIVFEPLANQIERTVAQFECVPCQDLLDWNPLRNWWYCPSCKYEMTPAEADLLTNDAKQLLLDLSAKSGGKQTTQWALIKWFRKLLGLKALSS